MNMRSSRVFFKGQNVKFTGQQAWAIRRRYEQLPSHGTRFVMNSVGKVTAGIILLHDHASRYMARTVRDQLNVMIY
jgi:hypothetical protein